MTAPVLVLIPAYNEAANLAPVVAEVRAAAPGCDVLVVDDGSTDDTARVLEQCGASYLRLPLRLGVGGAVRAGLCYGLERGYRAAVRLDADGQHPAEAVAPMLAALEHADAVRGSRYLAPTAYVTPAGRRLGQRLLCALLRVLTGEPASDPTSGLWAFGPKALAFLAEHHPGGYGEPELALLLQRHALSVSEVAVEMRARRSGVSTLTPGWSLVAAARALLAFLVVPLRPRSRPSP
jgi:glycosyltransferase involved in cell wall biosynthesis